MRFSMIFNMQLLKNIKKVTYGGPQVSRQIKEAHGKLKNATAN